MFQQTGKYIIAAGVILVLIGIIFNFFGNHLKFPGRSPGDIRIEKENFNFYFPVVTCILLSVVVTIALWLIRFFSSK